MRGWRLRRSPMAAATGWPKAGLPAGGRAIRARTRGTPAADTKRKRRRRRRPGPRTASGRRLGRGRRFWAAERGRRASSTLRRGRRRRRGGGERVSNRAFSSRLRRRPGGLLAPRESAAARAGWDRLVAAAAGDGLGYRDRRWRQSIRDHMSVRGLGVRIA